MAQRIEHLTTDQKVGGSSPSKRTEMTRNSQPRHFSFWIIPFKFRSTDSDSCWRVPVLTPFWVSNEVLGKAEKMPLAQSAMSFQDADAAQSIQMVTLFLFTNSVNVHLF